MNAGERLDQIQARVDAATEGPWEFDPAEGYLWAGPEHDQQEVGVAVFDGDGPFIAATRQDIPALVAALRAILNLAQEHVPSDEHTSAPRISSKSRANVWVTRDAG